MKKQPLEQWPKDIDEQIGSLEKEILFIKQRIYEPRKEELETLK